MLLASVYRSFGLVAPVTDAVVELMFSDAFRKEHPTVVDRHVATWKTHERSSVVRSLRAIAFRDDLLSRLGDIRVPTLVITGEADRALPTTLSDSMARGIDGARLVRIAGAGHMSAIEQPDATARALLEFLEALALRSGRDSD
jgi:pimeloyl-ACP methyl ester carboxylesterase